MSRNANQSVTARQIAGPVCDTATVEADIPDTIVEITGHTVEGGTGELVSQVTLRIPESVPFSTEGTLQVSGDGLGDTTEFNMGAGGERMFEFTFTGVEAGNYELCAEVTEATVVGLPSA